MNNETMSDEHLAALRDYARRHRDGAITGLLDEVDRLRAALAGAELDRDAASETARNYHGAAIEAVDRAARAEAALARVTEHCTAEREKIRATYVQTGASPARYLGYADACDDVLATIRAVAAGEQTEGGDRG